MNRRLWRIGVAVVAGLALAGVGLFTFSYWMSEMPDELSNGNGSSGEQVHSMHSGQPASTAANSKPASANATQIIAEALDANHNQRLDDAEYSQIVELWNSKGSVPGTDGLVIDQATFLTLTDSWLKGTLVSAPLQQNVSTPASTATKDPLANEFLNECLTSESKLSCYIERFQKVITEYGTERALTILEQVAAVDQAALTAGHPLAHEIGRFSYQYYGDAKTAIAHCREMFDSGCYHGVLESVLTMTPNITPEAVGGLCDAAVGTGQSNFVKFQCVHGLGHGLLMHFHEIPVALSYCDALTDSWEQGSCYGGVFMENIVAVNTTNPHHPHPHKLDPNDPLSPCDKVDKKYQSSCYLLQSSAILMLNGYDFAKGFKTCEQAPQEFIVICYQSMGRDISGYTLRNVDRSYQLCLLGSATYISQCIIGVAKDFVNNSAKAEPGLGFCHRVDAAYKGICNTAVGQMVSEIFPDPENRREACAKAEEGYQNICGTAAGVPR